jgi:WD40 repeat protein
LHFLLLYVRMIAWRGAMRMRVGFWAPAAVLALWASADIAHGTILPPTEPILRIETNTHNSLISRIGVDAACHLMVTGSTDKTTRLWVLPDSGVGEPKLMHVLRTPIGPNNDGSINAVAISPDGRFVATGGLDVYGAQTLDNAVYIFDTKSGRLIRRLGKLENVVRHLTFSSDGKHMAATLGKGGGLRVWNTENWTLVSADTDYGGTESFGAAYDVTGKLYTVAHDGFLRRYGHDLKLEMKVKTLGGHKPYSVAVRSIGDRIAIGFSDTAAIEVYDAKNLKLLFAAAAAGRDKRGNLHAVGWTADGAELYAGGQNHGTNKSEPKGIAVRVWDKEGQGAGRDVYLARDTIMALLPCRDAMAVATADASFGLISLSGQKRFWLEGVRPDMRNKIRSAFSVSDDGSKVRFGLGAGGERPILFDLRVGALKDQLESDRNLYTSDTTSLKITDWEDEAAPIFRGSKLSLDPIERARSVSIAPGSERFVLGADWAIRAYDQNGKQLWRKYGPDVAWGVDITRDGKFVVVAYGDGTIRWRRLSDGEEVLALFVHAKTREWVLWTPQGYYASSVAGDQYIGWQINRGWEQAGEFVTAARLKKHLYRPDIIKRAFELADPVAAISDAGLSDFKLADLTNHTPPEFRIIGSGDNSHVDTSLLPLRVEFTGNDDLPIGLDVKVNGRQVTPPAMRDLKPSAASKIRALNIPLEKGKNKIQITAHNAVGDSVQEVLVRLDKSGALDKKGKLFILAIGVDKYPKLGAENSLHFAAADARMMLDTLTKRAGPLHTQVISKLLVSGGDVAPTKANIEDALLFLRDAGPEDTVILFLAGHGVNEGADYLYMPEDAVGLDQKFWRPSTVLKWSVLQSALQDSLGNRVMFVDTCHSRGAYNARLIKDAADNNIVVFSATDSATEAQERSDLGHGVFTYALDKGLRGGADFMKRGAINVTALFEFVSDEVKRLTNDQQEPTFSAAGVKNFVIAKP